MVQNRHALRKNGRTTMGQNPKFGNEGAKQSHLSVLNHKLLI
jgi:hypothetical protein